MKTIMLYISMLLIFLTFFAGCFVQVTVNNPVVSGDNPSMIKLVSGALFGIYELVVRLIPTVKDYSVISLVIKILKYISDASNIRAPN